MHALWRTGTVVCVKEDDWRGDQGQDGEGLATGSTVMSLNVSQTSGTEAEIRTHSQQIHM